MTDTLESSDSDISPGVSHEIQESMIEEDREAQPVSPRKDAFRKDTIFGNVCCMSSSTSKSTGLHCTGCKSSSGSPLDDGPHKKPSRPSENQKTCGKGICLKGRRSNGEHEQNVKDSESDRILELEGKNAPSSSEPPGQEAKKFLTFGKRSSSDIVNHSNVKAAPSTTGFEMDPYVAIIERGSENADVNGGRGTNKNIQANERPLQAETAERLKPPEPYKCSPRRNRAMPLADLDAIEDDLQTPATTASIENPSRDESHRLQQQLKQQQQVSADVLWEFNGRRLSNFCQNLMIECDPLDGETVQTGPTGTAVLTHETCIDDDYNSSGYSTGKSNREFPSEVACGVTVPLDCRGINSNPILFDRSRYMGDSAMVSIKPIAETAFTEHSMESKTLSFASKADGRRPPGLPSNSHKRRSETQSSGINGTQSNVEPISTNAIDNKPGLNLSPAECDEKSSPGKVENDSDALKPTGRRGRTMERGKYDSTLLKDFIKPDQKKFSIAPPSQDFSLDTEMAIWEPSDFVQDRHKSAPPADLSMKLARGEDTSLSRSRQTSVSPQRQRISSSGPRWMQGSKSVEFLSTRQMSPSGAKIRRRTLSKEWQILTFTTREEITTLIRPKTTDPRDAAKNIKGERDASTTDARFSRFTSTTDDDLYMADSSDFSASNIPKDTDILSPSNFSKKSKMTETCLRFGASDSSGSSNEDAWEVVSGAMSDAMKEVELAGKASSTANQESTQDTTESPEMLASRTVRANSIPFVFLSDAPEVSNENNSEKSERRNVDLPMEMDELVKALMDLASESDNDALNQRPMYTCDRSSDFSKMTTDGFLDFSNNNNNNDTPTSWLRESYSLDDRNQFHSSFNGLSSECDSSVIQNDPGFSVETKNGKTITDRNPLPPERQTEIMEYRDESEFEEKTFDCANYAGPFEATTGNESALRITEGPEMPGSEDRLFDAAESIEHNIPAEQIDRTVGRPDDDGADSDDAEGRRRVASKDEDGAAEETPRSRHADNDEVFPEKAFVESLFSSLGTIVFLLLAALIFHLFNRLVEHEL